WLGTTLFHHLLDRWRDGIRPDLITFFIWMQEVGHYRLGELAIRIEEFCANIEVLDRFAVVEAGDDPVNVLDFLADLFALRLVRRVRARKHSQQQDFPGGTFGLDLLDNRCNTFGDLRRGVGSGV